MQMLHKNITVGTLVKQNNILHMHLSIHPILISNLLGIIILSLLSIILVG